MKLKATQSKLKAKTKSLPAFGITEGTILEMSQLKKTSNPGEALSTFIIASRSGRQRRDSVTGRKEYESWPYKTENNVQTLPK